MIWSSAWHHAASTAPSRFQVLQVSTPRCCNLIVVDWPPPWYQHILYIVFPAIYAHIPVCYHIIPDALPLDYCATVHSDHQVLYNNMHLSYLESVYEGILQSPVSKLLQLWIGHHLHILHLKYICWIFTIFSSSTIAIGLLWIGHTTCIPNHSTLPQQIYLPNKVDTNRLFDLKLPIWGQEKKWMAKKSWLVMRPDPKAGFRVLKQEDIWHSRWMSPSGKDSADNRLLRLPNLLLMLWHSATDVSGRQMSLMVSIIPVYLSLKSWNPCHSDKVHCSLQLMLSNVGPNTLTRIRPPNVSSPFPRILETLKNRHEVCKTIHTFWGQNLLQKREIKTMKTICYHTVSQLYIPWLLYNKVYNISCAQMHSVKNNRGGECDVTDGKQRINLGLILNTFAALFFAPSAIH